MNINKNYKILVVDENSREIQSIKQLLLKDKSATFLSAKSADIAIELAWREKPDVIISNTRLVDLSGWEVLGILKKNDPTRLIPFIMLGDKEKCLEEEPKALDMGADDYICKPFTAEVFRSRVNAALRRYLHRSDQAIENEEILRSGKIEINMTTHMVFVKGKEVDLTPKEFALIYLFIKKQNRVLNRVFLSGTIWEREYFDTSHTIDKHIANLRKKLGTEGERIETLPTIGYKFIGEEEENYN